MEHYPLISFPNGLEITYSDIKKRKNGNEYVTIYFEQPNAKRTDFNSAEINYPGGKLRKICGYKKEQIPVLMDHVSRIGRTALDFSRGKSHA